MPAKKALGLTSMTAALVMGLAACSGGGSGDGGSDVEPLQFGYILPETGPLAYLGPPQIAGAKFAIQEINEAGGVLGAELPDILSGDEAGDGAIAADAADRLLNQNVHAILGAASSGMTMSFIDRVTQAEVVQCSGANTAPTLSDYDDGGYFWRTAPSDLLTGPVLANEIVADGASSVAVIYRADDYGQGLAEATATALEEAGAEVVAQESYEPQATNFSSIVQSVSGEEPDAIALISFDEGVQLITNFVENGFGADQMYSADGMANSELGSMVDTGDPGIIDGFKGATPGVDNQAFNEKLAEMDSSLKDYVYGPQIYDCAMVVALAAEAAESTDPAVFVEQMAAVTTGETSCSTFAECRDILADGGTIDFQGQSGPLDFDENGDITVASYQIYGFEDGGEFKALSYTEAGA
ncbi:ABC transporter substrate-binding protein [Nocardiopsis ansamitocini]|uniref:Branched-chain amino acid ABC transporter substrate-binding protein n=1 Tax=Nocardiopsis ansamitocini TaxID=1670832 RepID=A0A9W6UGV9_9ACTN|nr:ABC transporter substrate-binding protein [Nocardiopsis ansamitocini]GLU45904.1 branched-chain amino acid ABC transporter substrate-binding protein [Nocardiopsis ansamitocini]